MCTRVEGRRCVATSPYRGPTTFSCCFIVELPYQSWIAPNEDLSKLSRLYNAICLGINIQGHWNSCAELSINYINIRHGKTTAIKETGEYTVLNIKMCKMSNHVAINMKKYIKVQVLSKEVDVCLCLCACM